MRKDIRTKIVDTLNERQLNRRNLAEYTGISQSTITKILGRFIENPSKDTLVTMCEKLHLTYNPTEVGRFEYTAASFTQEELVAFNDALEAKLREGKSDYLNTTNQASGRMDKKQRLFIYKYNLGIDAVHL